VGQEPVIGPWLTVDRAMIDMFTGLSHENSFIHTDSE
jgi:acyl dehydratase